MKTTKLTTRLLTLSLLLAGSAVAGTANKETLKFDESVTVGDKQLPPGRYEVEWTGTGSDVQVTISHGRNEVAKVAAQIIPLQKAGIGSGYSTNADQAGNKTLTEIFFGGKRYELSIGQASAAISAPSDKSRGSN